MAQILDPLPSDRFERMLCCYVNATSKIQVARITNIANWYFERVVFPGQRLVFETVPEAYLEIHTGMMASAILSDKIPCSRLQIREGNQTLEDQVKESDPIGAAKTYQLQSWESLNKKPKSLAESLMTPALTTID